MPTAGHLDGHNQDPNPDERDTDPQTPLLLLKKPLPKPTSMSKRMALLFHNWWLWEIVSAGIAVLAVTVVIAILVVFDQSSLPDWPSIFTVRSIYISISNLLLIFRFVDKFGHILLCHNSEIVHHFGCWSLNIAIEMVVVPPGRASASERPSTFRRCQSGAMGSCELVA